MAFEPTYLVHRQPPEAPSNSPVRTLLYVSSQGMVFKSASVFDSGTRLAIGLHLRKICGDLGLSEDDSGLYGDRFLKLEGLVADCKIVETSALESFYQVTLIFDKLPEGDRLLLEAVEKSHPSDAGLAKAKTIPLSAPPARSNSAFPDCGGLN
jgi:hypothetical protein